MTADRSIRSNGARLDRAIAIGRELRGIRDNPDLHRLSRKGWLRLCLGLAGWAREADLAAAWAKLASFPYLLRAVEIRATLWRDQGQDRPARYAGFADGERDPAAYSELLHSGLSVDQASAVAAWHCAASRPGATFGVLGDFSELAAMIDPRHAELAVLDRELEALWLYRDLAWTPAGPVIRHSRYEVPAGPGVHARIASNFAEAVLLGPMIVAIAR